MRPRNFAKESRHLGRAWYAMPTSIFAAFVAALVVVSWSEGTFSGGDTSAVGPMAVMPSVNSPAYPVPSAASVFSDGKHEVAEHVDTF